MNLAEWTTLMDEVVEQAQLEEADYTPGNAIAPGSGSAGDDPLGVRFAHLGPLAFVLNEAVDAACVRGADRDALIASIAQGAQCEPKMIESVLSGKTVCPPQEVLQSFSQGTSIDGGIILDAAQRGGCKNYGPTRFPPGY